MEAMRDVNAAVVQPALVARSTCKVVSIYWGETFRREVAPLLIVACGATLRSVTSLDPAPSEDDLIQRFGLVGEARVSRHPSLRFGGHCA